MEDAGGVSSPQRANCHKPCDAIIAESSDRVDLRGENGPHNCGARVEEADPDDLGRRVARKGEQFEIRVESDDYVVPISGSTPDRLVSGSGPNQLTHMSGSYELLRKSIENRFGEVFIE